MLMPDTRLPDATFDIKAADGSTSTVTVADVFEGRTVVLVGVPGAFTSTCHNAHVPQFVANAEALRRRGADRVAVLSVNDRHVMRAWAEALKAVDKIDFLADPLAAFTRAIEMDVDLAPAGLGLRCRRFSAIVRDRVVATVNVEPKGSRGISATGAASALTQL